MDKRFDPSAYEQKWQQRWAEEGYFAAAESSDRESYCIMIPPPNVTGALHIGHALQSTIQDLLTRWKRMQGFNALWLPGTDHAGIATQLMVERQLAGEGLDRREMGREAFIERVWEWKQPPPRRDPRAARQAGRELRLEPRALHPRRQPLARGGHGLRAAARARA